MRLYSLSRKLPSCQVKRLVLEDLEKYIIDKVKAVADKGEAASYGLTITDSIGAENLPSIREYEKPYFSDDTKGIAMTSRIIGNSSKLSIELKFSVIEMSSKIEVTSNVEPARETAMNIAEEIVRRLNDYKTRNYLFDQHSVYSLIASLSCLFGAFGLGLSLVAATPYKGLLGGISGTVFILSCGWFALRRSKPYSTFETRLNEKRERRANLIVGVIISFIFVNVIGTYLRVKFLGF